MKCELSIVSGARSGHRDVYDKSYIGIGRHPLSDVRFDAEKDLDASTRHAAIVKAGDAWVLRDLGSTNGTYVNGEKMTGDRPLEDGDVMKFGLHGPEVSFHVIQEDHEAEVVMAAIKAPPPRPAVNKTAPELASLGKGARPSADTQEMDQATAPSLPTIAPVKGAQPPSRTAVLRAEISHQQSRARWLAILLFVLILGALGVVYWQGKQSTTAITAGLNTVDSLNREIAALRRLQSQADSERVALQTELASERDPTRRTAITTRIATVERRAAAIQQAQGVDYTAIRNANDRAVAILYVRFPDTTRMWTGTGFSVNAQGQMLTNRHVVTAEDGSPPREIAVQFSGSNDVHPARLVRTSPNSDIAVVQLESAGPFPAVAGFADSGVVEGAPIATIGFPGGGTQATLVTGSVARIIPDSLYELDSFSGVGASGSPIFDRYGKVIGILFGGRVGSGGRAVLGLPISRAQALLR